MSEQGSDPLLRQINQHLGIAHKISRIYFDGDEARKDCVQEMMYQLWKSYPSFDNRAKFSTWMYRVCLNTALTFRNKENRGKGEPIRDRHYEIPDHGTSDKQEETELLWGAISKLTDLNKAIIFLYLEDQSYEEIAEVTGLTKSNVSVRLVRIRRELETIIKENIKHF
jgi:RNA polymerase sigma-70 factor (ECF subfamily)